MASEREREYQIAKAEGRAEAYRDAGDRILRAVKHLTDPNIVFVVTAIGTTLHKIGETLENKD